MQFGVFTIGDVTADPTNGATPTEKQRIDAMTQIALKAEEVGLDVFATASTTTRRSSRLLRRPTWPTLVRKPPPSCSPHQPR